MQARGEIRIPRVDCKHPLTKNFLGLMQASQLVSRHRRMVSSRNFDGLDRKRDNEFKP